MATVYYKATVQQNGSITLAKEARDALNLQPGDEIEIQVETGAVEQEMDELRKALDIGLDQLQRGEYSVYTRDTVQDLVNEVKEQGRNRLAQTRTRQAP